MDVWLADSFALLMDSLGIRLVEHCTPCLMTCPSVSINSMDQRKHGPLVHAFPPTTVWQRALQCQPMANISLQAPQTSQSEFGRLAVVIVVSFQPTLWAYILIRTGVALVDFACH